MGKDQTLSFCFLVALDLMRHHAIEKERYGRIFRNPEDGTAAFTGSPGSRKQD
jgi:hypothetical protein